LPLLYLKSSIYATIIWATAREDVTPAPPTVYPPAEFRSKLAAGHHFLNAVLRGPMFFLIGDKRELARLVKKPLAH
jgi:hypothetical protein